jgi:diaminopimelate epimerase
VTRHWCHLADESAAGTGTAAAQTVAIAAAEEAAAIAINLEGEISRLQYSISRAGSHSSCATDAEANNRVFVPGSVIPMTKL